jgi:hypothetical protein
MSSKETNKEQQTCENCFYSENKEYEHPCRNCPVDFQYKYWEPKGRFNKQEKERIAVWLTQKYIEYKKCNQNPCQIDELLKELEQ